VESDAGDDVEVVEGVIACVEPEPVRDRGDEDSAAIKRAVDSDAGDDVDVVEGLIGDVEPAGAPAGTEAVHGPGVTRAVESDAVDNVDAVVGAFEPEDEDVPVIK